MKKPGKRPMLQTPMDEEKKEMLREAAKREGYLELAVWVRKVLFDRAEKVLKKAGS